MTPVSLVVLLSLSDVTEGARPILLRTLMTSLDPGRVSLKLRVIDPSQAPRLDELSVSAAVVQVTWRTANEALIRAALRPRAFTERSLAFSKSDPLRERARAVAFTVAAMMPQWQPETPLPEAEVLPPVEPLSESDFTTADAGVREAGEAGLPFKTPLVTVDAGTPPLRIQALAELAGAGVVPGPSAAGQIAGGVCIGIWCAGLSAALGAGPVEAAQARRLDIRAAAFGEIRLAPWANGALGLSTRFSVGGAWLHIVRGDIARDRASPYAQLEAGPLVRVGVLDITFSLGALAWGATALLAGNTALAELPPVVATGRLGLGLRW